MMSTKSSRTNDGSKYLSTSALTFPKVLCGRCLLPSLNARSIRRLKSGRGGGGNGLKCLRGQRVTVDTQHVGLHAGNTVGRSGRHAQLLDSATYRVVCAQFWERACDTSSAAAVPLWARPTFAALRAGPWCDHGLRSFVNRHSHNRRCRYCCHATDTPAGCNLPRGLGGLDASDACPGSAACEGFFFYDAGG
jgi:hypothetical protein